MSGLARRDSVDVGETIELEPDLLVCDRAADEVIEKFGELPGELMFNSARIVIALSEVNPSGSGSTAGLSRGVRQFAERHRLRACLEHAQGCCQQIMVEQGTALPGMLCIGATDGMSSLGAINSLGWQVELENQAAILASGRLSLTVPHTLRVDITGRRSRGVYAGDVALSIVQRLAAEESEGKVIEYFGPSVSQMTISERFTLCAMA